MLKESRANVIFVVVLLILIAPGFVILMRKKLAGPTDPAHLPTLIPHQAAYIQPDPIPPRAPRVEPPEIRSWVTRQLHDRVAPDASLARDTTGAGAVVGDRYVAQLVHADANRLAMLVWSADAEHVSVTTDSGVSLGDVARTWVDVPKDVRHVLQKVGYISPPERIAWVEVRLTNGVASGTRLRIGYAGQQEALVIP